MLRASRLSPLFIAQPLDGSAPVALKERYVYDALGRLSQHLEYFDAAGRVLRRQPLR
ncbi:hypothetical protein [Lysobacter capsici]|uniref:hypothetical protein n=1 Tax=Lysobacter capsici TaxID=435897 RepID=UPI001364B97B|nr:hypothetical protein [Lysobacter capsici]